MESGIADRLGQGEALLVAGALNANDEDRYLERSQLHPLQVVDETGTARPVEALDECGELGIEGCLHLEEAFYLTTGNDLYRLHLPSRELRVLSIPNLKDVHNIEWHQDRIWLANTAYDEVVIFDPETEAISNRFSLEPAPPDNAADTSGPSQPGATGEETQYKYHLNQVLQGYDGDMYGLVHHIYGKQFLRRIAKKAIKRQGDGGVINLDTGERHQLHLRGPHTVRRVDGDYWIFDSQNCTVKIFDTGWKEKETFKVGGFGRGAAVSEKTETYFAGISETRERYLDLVSRERNVNMIEAFDIPSREKTGELLLEGTLEQVSNIHLVPGEVATALLTMDTEPHVKRHRGT